MNAHAIDKSAPPEASLPPSAQPPAGAVLPMCPGPGVPSGPPPPPP